MIPFNCVSCFEEQNIFSISTDPNFKFYSAISSDTIYIFDSQDPQFLQVASYKRTEESIKNQGPNHWLVWIDDTTIAFGTCAGSFFSIKFSNNQFTGSLFTTNVGGVISDVFSFNGLIGVCIIGPKIIFVNQNAQIVSSIEVSCQSPFIKCPSIFNDDFVFISNGQLMKCEISKNEIKNLISMNYKNIGIVCSYKDKYAFSTYEKNIFISTNQKAITKFFTANSSIVYMNFIDDGNSLLVIDQNGVFTLRNFIFNTNYILSLPDTKTMISSFYDTNSKRFFFLDSSYQIRCINFVTLNSSFAIGSSFIYSLTKQKMICEVPNMDHQRRIRSIPSDLYPIRSISINTESVFCIIGRVGISVFTDYSLFYEPDIIADFAVWINNMLIVISNKTMSLFTSELLPIGNLVLSENPNSVYSTNTRMIVSFPNKFIVYEFDPSKEKTFFQGSSGEKKLNKIGTKISFVSVSFNYPSAQIVKAFILWDSNDVFLHLINNSLINYQTNKTVWENVHYIWINQSPQFLCCYKAGSVNIMSTNSIATLPINSMWTVNKNIIHLPSNLQYENIKANFTDFSLKMMPIFSDDYSKYGTALTALLEADDFKTVLTAFLDNLQQEGKLSQYYLGLRQLPPNKVVLFLNEMSDEHISYLANTDFDFTSHFPEVKASIQSRILMHVNSEILDRILETHKAMLQEKEDRFKNFVCEKCIKTGQYIRGCIFANAADYNFCTLLTEKKKLFQSSLWKCILTIEKDYLSWGKSDRVTALKVVACSFNLVRLNNWALACFLILEDEGKVVSLLSDNVGTLLYAMRYTRDFKDTAHSKFLIDLQIGL